MALHTTLPIYKVTYDLLVLVTELTRNMSRDFKSTLGNDLRKECVDLVLLIYHANSASDKVPHLSKMLERLQVVELTLRLCSDLHLISRGQYAKAIALTDQIGKQANGWRKKSASTPAA
ncbi:hypothetical protein NH8B_0948 [Pseudogulbenkiania sp. NH8B]|uniref:four helix bundle protein n=1 Tax=Pseudogulbenkiania sp. (strain NH8B) TaxID=748280 RepID=UPI0002279A72|nr:four helix bundle protein [Pseudogulbenkiania sp. NH8B]BAK75780.1 hypothetical protein NH8B_0948 [Pseudogulbenkiania sp. NH8B]